MSVSTSDAGRGQQRSALLAAPPAIVWATLYVVAYVALDWLSYVRPLLALEITPWNPQAGLTVAFLLWMGPRRLGYTVVAAVLASLLTRTIPGSFGLLLLATAWIACGYAAIAMLMRRWHLTQPIQTSMEAAQMAALWIAGTLAIAAGHVGLYVAAGFIPASEAVAGITRYWVGDLNGVLAVTPLLLCAGEWRTHVRTMTRHRWEAIAQSAVVVGTLWIIFRLPAADQLRSFYLLFVPVVWIALRGGWPGAMAAVLALQIGLQVAAETKIPTARFIDLQFLMLTLSLTALLLGAVVTERAGVLRRVAAREVEQRAILSMAPDAVLTIHDSGRIRDANAAALRMFGAQLGEAQPPAIGSVLSNLSLDAPLGTATIEGIRHDGSTFPAEVAWARLDPPAQPGFLVTVRDATERRHAEQQAREQDAVLARAMRFAVAGQLASALAHELNQPITALVSYLHASGILAELTPAGDERLKTTLGKATHEALRAAEVLRRLRDFYQGGALKREAVALTSLCNGVAAAFQDRLRRLDATLLVRLDASMPTVQCDATQLEIVLHNLIGNAIDAVSQRPPGHRQILLQGAYTDTTAVLRVEDSGPGISAEVAQHLFEPFVTSKPDGMGLGLAISRSLIRATGGELSLVAETELGGAAFVVQVPRKAPREALV